MAGTMYSGRNRLQRYGWQRILMALVAIFGIWQIAAPYVLNFAAERPVALNSMVTGVLLVLFGAFSFFGADHWSRTLVRSFEGLAAVTGLWLFLSPWVLQYQAITPAFWSAIVVGLIVLVCAGFAAIRQPERPSLST